MMCPATSKIGWDVSQIQIKSCTGNQKLWAFSI